MNLYRYLSITMFCTSSSMSTRWGKKVQKKLNSKEIKEGAKINFGKLSLKGKTTWTERVKPLSQRILEEFPGVEKLEVEYEGNCKHKSGGNKRKVGEVGVLELKPPCHDFVQPAVVQHAKKACTFRQPILRIGMLSARLKERFGHLCTETG